MLPVASFLVSGQGNAIAVENVDMHTIVSELAGEGIYLSEDFRDKVSAGEDFATTLPDGRVVEVSSDMGSRIPGSPATVTFSVHDSQFVNP